MLQNIGLTLKNFITVILSSQQRSVYQYRQMRLTKSIFVILMLTIGVVLGGGSCPIQLSEQPKIASDQIKIQTNTPRGSNTSLINYSYPYKQDFGTAPATALGINGFDFQPSSTLGIQIVINKIVNSQADFQISLNQNAVWNQLRINFFSTSRADIEIGSVILGKNITTFDYCPLNYKFRKAWNTNSFLKFKIFLSGIYLNSDQNVIKLNLERADVSTTGIDFIYSTGGSSTRIDTLSADLIIFDSYNPAFRFAEGVISQNYLESKVQVQIPPQGVSELRTYMIGITSFEVNINALISLYSSMNDVFSLQIGPASDNCKVNYLSISYLIISVFPECGACPPYVINYNGNCVQSCPVGYYINNGKCEQKTCSAGSYLLNGVCKKCPKRSDIKECNNSCEAGYQLRGEDCFPICTLPNEEYSYSSCVCRPGCYRMKDNQCKQCPVGTRYDASKQACVSICNVNSYFDLQILTCKCNEGYNMIHGFCVKCNYGQVFDQTWGACRPDCGLNQYFNGKECICIAGYNLINGVCTQCRSDQVYNTNLQLCVPKCNANQVWQNNRCECASGFNRINGVCQKCGNGLVYEPSLGFCRPQCEGGQIWDDYKCKCLPGSYLINGSCQLCPAGSTYNEKLNDCEQLCKQRYQYFVNNKCVCIPGTVQDATGTCNPKQCPDHSQYNKQSDTCVCDDGYYLDPVLRYCVTVPKCPPNSVFISVTCVCNQGYNYDFVNKVCVKCDKYENEVFNGQQCVCVDGYIRNKNQKCVKIEVIPICDDNQVYNKGTKSCECKSGCQRIKGKCIEIPKCDDNQYWNGQDCVCKTGYTWNKTKKQCEKVQKEIPKCPYNSHFNGVKCICNDKFFELQPGLCAICPPNMSWNGKKCAYSKDCWAGYKWDKATQCCVPKATECPPNSAWNGQSCQCNAGFFSYNNQCAQCQAGYQFDGSSCVRVQYNVSCPGANMIVVNMQCVCRPGTNNYNGNCIQCPYPTVWNGWYCQGNNDGCFTVPNSHINPVDRRCECDTGYRPVEGSCISIGLYPHSNKPQGQSNDWDKGYDNNEKKGGFGGSSSFGGNSFSWDSNSIGSGAVQQTGTNYEFTNPGKSSVPQASTYPLPPAPTGYAYYMLDSNGNTVPYSTSSPYQYNPNMPYGQIFTPTNPVKIGGVVAVGVDPAINGGNLGLYANPSASNGVVYPGVNTPSYGYNNNNYQHRSGK